MFVSEKISDLLAKNPFTNSVEVFPPRNGNPPSIILDKLKTINSLPIDFVSVTKGAMGSMRGGTVPIGYMISERYKMNALVHFRCRDMNKREVENLLVDHIYFGTKNILAVLGDPIPGESTGEPDQNTHNRYASELVGQISDMNRGRYLPMEGVGGDRREGLKTDFCIGVACYPEAEDMEQELYVMEEKVKAGADFAITQMIFDSKSYFKYLDDLKARGIDIPVIAGLRPVSCMEHVIAAETIFGAAIPKSLKEDIRGMTRELARKICIDFSISLHEELKQQGAPGAHLFILNDVGMARDIIERL